MTHGDLLPDDVVMQVVKQRLQQSDCEAGYILDGFPRTVAQAQLLQQFLASNGPELSRVLSFEVSLPTLTRRLSNRLTCPQCGTSYRWQGEQIASDSDPRCGHDNSLLVRRKDDEPETIQKRLRVFEQQTAPLKSFYDTCGLLCCVNAEGDVGDVWHRLQKQLKEIEGHNGLASTTRSC